MSVPSSSLWMRSTFLKSSSKWHAPNPSAWPSSSRAIWLPTSRTAWPVNVRIVTLPLFSTLGMESYIWRVPVFLELTRQLTADEQTLLVDVVHLQFQVGYVD